MQTGGRTPLPIINIDRIEPTYVAPMSAINPKTGKTWRTGDGSGRDYCHSCVEEIKELPDEFKKGSKWGAYESEYNLITGKAKIPYNFEKLQSSTPDWFSRPLYNSERPISKEDVGKREYFDKKTGRSIGVYENGGELPEAGSGYKVVRSSERKGKTHKVTGPDGTVKFFGDSKLGQHPKDPARKKAFYARHKKNLAGNPYFRAFARKTWEEGGELDNMAFGGNLILEKYQDGGSNWEILPQAQTGTKTGYSWSTQQTPTQQVVGSAENTQFSPSKSRSFNPKFDLPKASLMTSQTGEQGLGKDIGEDIITAALLPGRLPITFGPSFLGKAATNVLEIANPLGGFRGVKPKFALQNADPIITNQTKGFNVEYDGLLDFQKKADFEPYRFDNKNWYDVPEQSQIDLDKISKLKSIKPSEYFDRRQFVKKLIEKGIVSKKTDIQKYARSLEDTKDLTKRAIEQANTYYRGVTPKIPTKTDIGLGGRDIDQNKVIKAMQDAGVDLSNEEEIGKYMASHVPLYQFGYRSGVGDARGLDALYTSKGHSSYGDMTFELKKPFNFSEGSYKDWLNTYETPSPIYEDIQKIRELEWKKNFPEKKGSYYMSNENFNAEYPKWMIPYKYGDHIFMGKKGERIFDNVKKVEGEIGRTKSKDLPYKNGGKVKLKPKSSNWEIVSNNEWEIIK